MLKLGHCNLDSQPSEELDYLQLFFGISSHVSVSMSLFHLLTYLQANISSFY